MLAIDYLGHGFTDKPKITYNLPTFPNTCWISWMRRASRKAHLVGESQGGQISVLTAYEHPERVNKLALIVGGIPSNEHGYTSGLNQSSGAQPRSNRHPTRGNDPQAHGMAVSRSKCTLPDELVDIRLKIYKPNQLFKMCFRLGIGKSIT